ncbi:MAG: tetratricopeptide repeat protein, partial [Desulfococcaceae bacterium]
SSLAEQAEAELSTGQVDRAFSTAERAIRIDPNNPKLWNLLARIQMERSNFAQAEQLARKSNLLSRGDRALQARNWRIISDSFQERGETEAAKAALRKAWELE